MNRRLHPEEKIKTFAFILRVAALKNGLKRKILDKICFNNLRNAPYLHV